MHFARFVQAMAQFQCAGMTVHDHGDGRAQAIPVTQPILDSGVEPFQMFDRLAHGISLNGYQLLSARQFTQ